MAKRAAHHAAHIAHAQNPHPRAVMIDRFRFNDFFGCRQCQTKIEGMQRTRHIAAHPAIAHLPVVRLAVARAKSAFDASGTQG